MNNIYKYTLSPKRRDNCCPVEIPSGAVILSAAFQDMNICIWASVDTRNVPHLKTRVFHVIATGAEVPTGKTLRFIDTIHNPGMSLVFHVFVEPETFTLNRTA